ncbi:TIGR03564 family F420-dependent LLM class oxidoreductase [Pseudonocardia lacus]|uniref:TIGR03564 family F420-dependent LLM class oxidoreductase n=1 Tax=Pseudonocardia lacus TaxID=2835865 RepID=UPI001BDC23FB|nr:TIGR03564 family F420-dependent LLM class oxidoreductase [Pseudonocardia lacus]
MQIGLWIDDDRPLDEVVAEVERAARLGFARAWLGQRVGWDPLAVLAAVGSRAPGIGLGTAIVPTWPRHPLALAAQALTTQAAVGGRLSLGVGPSHQALVEGRFGVRWQRPGRHVADYLDALVPALAGREVDVRGETVTALGGIALPAPAPPAPPVLLSAHGPRLLRLAGERTDGVITTWVRAEGLAEHVVPAVLGAAAGRAAPQVVVGVVATVTDDPGAARAHVGEVMGLAGQLPSYRRALDRDGLPGPQDTVLAGDEAALEREVRRFADAGATELQLCPVGPPAERARTVEFFAELARAAAYAPAPV